MSKYYYLVVVLLVLGALAGFYFYYSAAPKGQEAPVVEVAPVIPQAVQQGLPQTEVSGNNSVAVPSAPVIAPILGVPPSISVGENHIIEIIDNAFKPAFIQIKKGDSVTWINRMSASSWPASAVHPTHAVYPETGGCIASKFDACHSLKTGESWTFTFNEIGSWKYHDHISAGIVKPGTIEVSL
ncbi:MAG: hypothetical protein HYW34_03090 [Candidatus Brennerbacteria bacterium]|nr:hypothetical protein [Candidatus Brennerbacteria bacterium]